MRHQFYLGTVLAVILLCGLNGVKCDENNDASEEESLGDKVWAAIQTPASKLSHFAVDRIDYKTTKYMYDVYKECLQGCWQYVLSEDDLISCISAKKEGCQNIKKQRAKDLLIYYSTLYAQGKALQATRNKLSSILHLNGNSDDDSSEEERSLKEKIFHQGIKIAKSAIKAKATSMALDAGKKAIQDALSGSSRRRRRDADTLVDKLKQKAMQKGIEMAKSAAKKKAAKAAFKAGKNAVMNAITSNDNFNFLRSKRDISQDEDVENKPSGDVINNLKQSWAAVHKALKESSDNIRKEVENEIMKQWSSLESGKQGVKNVIVETHNQSMSEAKKLLDSWLISEKKMVEVIRNISSLASGSTKAILNNLAEFKKNGSESLETLPLNVAVEIGQLVESWIDSGKAVIEASDKAIEQSITGVNNLLNVISETQRNVSEKTDNAHLDTVVGLGRFLESLMESGTGLSKTLEDAKLQTKSGAEKIVETLSEALSKLPKIAEDAVKVTVDNLANQDSDEDNSENN